MNLFEQTKKICQLHNIRPSRTKGQNFLINEEVYNKIVEVADLKKDDIVLEVGPGLGFLTEKLAKKAKKVIAVELDDKLAELLEKTLATKEIKNVEVVNGDILGIRNQELGIRSSNYKVVANLPYNITSIFLRKFLSSDSKPESMTLMVQKEVAERIVAKSSDPRKDKSGLGKMSLLAVSVQFYSEARIVGYVASKDFWPEPEVYSAVINLKVNNTPPATLDRGDFEKDFFRLVKIGFSSKRKMLKNNLANGYHIKSSEALKRIKSANFKENIRAQELSVEDWKKLLPYFSK